MKALVCIGCGKIFIGADNRKYHSNKCREKNESKSAYKHFSKNPVETRPQLPQAIPNKYTRKKWS